MPNLPSLSHPQHYGDTHTKECENVTSSLPFSWGWRCVVVVKGGPLPLLLCALIGRSRSVCYGGRPPAHSP